MRPTRIGIVLSVLFASAMSGQTQAEVAADRLFPFTHADTVQEFTEIANAVRSTGGIQQVSVDEAARTLAVHGSAGQLALAEWLFHGLDQPVAGQGSANARPILEYRMVDGANPVVRVFYLTNTATPAARQEIVNAVRSIMDLRYVFVYNATGAMVVRGTLDQATGAEWILNALDKPAGAQPPARLEYQLANVPGPVARIFYLQNAASPQGLLEVLNSVRAVADVQRAVPSNASRALAMRGTADQMALAEWLVSKLDQPAGQASSNLKYPMPASADGIAEVFYLAAAATPQSLQTVVNQVRTTVNIQRVSSCSGPRALGLRGTVDQVAMAERLIQQWETGSPHF